MKIFYHIYVLKFLNKTIFSEKNYHRGSGKCAVNRLTIICCPWVPGEPQFGQQPDLGPFSWELSSFDCLLQSLQNTNLTSKKLQIFFFVEENRIKKRIGRKWLSKEKFCKSKSVKRIRSDCLSVICYQLIAIFENWTSKQKIGAYL